MSESQIPIRVKAEGRGTYVPPEEKAEKKAEKPPEVREVDESQHADRDT